MNRIVRAGGTIAVSLLIGLSYGLGGAAQESTPAVDMSPNGDECVLEPRTLEELQAIYGEAHLEGAGEATSVAMSATPAITELPVGEPADAETIEAITMAVRHQFACFNGGDHLRGLAGVTDEFIVSQVGLALFDEDFVAMLEAEPVHLSEEEQTTLHGIRDVTVYEDGRVGALVDYEAGLGQEEGIDGFETDLWIFKNVDGVWLLDESHQNLEHTHAP
jgi:hypothetical protein